MMSWLKLLRWSAIAAVIVVALINLFAGIIPPLLVFALLWIGAIAWMSRSTKGPAILLLVAFVAFIALSAPFTIPSLAVPASAGDFILNVAGLLAALTGIVAAIAVIRGRTEAAPAARSIGMAAAAVFVVAAAFSVFSAVTYDDAELQEGDVELVAQDIEFRQTSLQAEGGEVSVFVENQDSTLHTFTIEELDVDLDVPASKSARVTFDAEPGEYEFFCEPHKEDMKGTLTIE
jgi:plastocyanin